MTNSASEGKPLSPSEKKRENDRLRMLAALRKRIPDEQGVGCFLCRLFVEDFEKNGKLTDHPYDANGKGLFPVAGKTRHLQLELISLDSPSAPAV